MIKLVSGTCTVIILKKIQNGLFDVPSYTHNPTNIGFRKPSSVGPFPIHILDQSVPTKESLLFSTFLFMEYQILIDTVRP